LAESDKNNSVVLKGNEKSNERMISTEQFHSNYQTPIMPESVVDFSQLKKNLKKDFSGLTRIKVALLGDTATQFLSQAIRGMGYRHGYNIDLWEAEFNQISRQILDYSSELYQFSPEIVILFESSHKLLNKFNRLNPIDRLSFAQQCIDNLNLLTNTLLERCNSKIIYFNFSEINDMVFGNYANKIPSSFICQLRKLNYLLIEKASNTPHLFICDVASIQNRFGKQKIFSPAMYVTAEMVVSLDILPEIANAVVSIIAAMNGKFKKCIIFDLDDTIWGGVIGDDGMENIQLGNLGIGKAFSEFQYWIKSLQQRGIILAVCSKNSEDIAKKPFENHPDMVLRLNDIAVFVANWENKVDNIYRIQKILKIGFDSMVFIDDNPFERNVVRDNIPEICVPELPEDPAEYLEYLYGLNLFETASSSLEDGDRTRQYQVETERAIALESFVNVDDFLKSLNMLSVVTSFNAFNTPRIAQLSLRSNQFNLRTIRYSEEDIRKISESNDYQTFAFTLQDKYGDNGIICAIILKKENDDTFFIDTWFMSCRVLKRGMEGFVLNTIIKKAKEAGIKFLKGEYIPTAKNGLVKNHFKNLGFFQTGNFWTLRVEKYEEKECFLMAQ